jgi:hypothetical protein
MVFRLFNLRDGVCVGSLQFLKNLMIDVFLMLLWLSGRYSVYMQRHVYRRYQRIRGFTDTCVWIWLPTILHEYRMRFHELHFVAAPCCTLLIRTLLCIHKPGQNKNASQSLEDIEGRPDRLSWPFPLDYGAVQRQSLPDPQCGSGKLPRTLPSPAIWPQELPRQSLDVAIYTHAEQIVDTKTVRNLSRLSVGTSQFPNCFSFSWRRGYEDMFASLCVFVAPYS